MNEQNDEPVVAHAPQEHRYEISVGDRLAGFTVYLDRGEQRIFYHTEIGDEFGGRGLAGTLVRQALDETRDAGLRIVPVCPYVARWVREHHDVDDVLDPVTKDALAAVREATSR